MMVDPIKDAQRESWNAEKKNLRKKQQKVLDLLWLKGPLATYQISAELGYADRQGAAPRLTELEDAGEIYDTGIDLLNPKTCRKNTVYALKPKPLIQVTLT